MEDGTAYGDGVADPALETFCRDLLERCDFAGACAVADELYTERSSTLGKDHRATVEAAALLARALAGLGETAQLHALREETFRRCRRLFSADDPLTLRWQHGLVESLRVVGETERSVDLADDLVVRRRRLLGEDHEHTLAAGAALAASLFADGHGDAARGIAEDLWKRWTRHHGEGHPDTLAAAYWLVQITPHTLVGAEARQRTLQGVLEQLDRVHRRAVLLGRPEPHSATFDGVFATLRATAASYDPIGAAYAGLPGTGETAGTAEEADRLAAVSLLDDGAVDSADAREVGVTAAAIRSANERIVDRVRALFRRNDPLTALRCARRVPHEWIRQSLEDVLGRPLDDSTMRHVVSESPLLAANIALQCGNEPAGRPQRTVATMRDGIRIAVLCALHRAHTYLLNTEVRYRLAGHRTPSLIDSYVLRSGRASDVRADVIAGLDAEADRVTGLTPRLSPLGRTTITLTGPDGPTGQKIVLAHFLPFSLSGQRSRQWSRYLRHPDAAPHLGDLPFERWWTCWVGLNEVAARWTVADLAPRTSDAATPDERTRLRLLAEAHNQGMVEVERVRLRNSVMAVLADDPPSRQEYDAFVSSLTWRPGARHVEFVESPAIFYPSGDEWLLWDLLRHGGVLPGLARRVASKRGGAGKDAGKEWEDHVDAALESHRVVSHLRRDVRILSSGREALQIDHGFVVDDLLVLVESKSWTKSPGYYVAHHETFPVRADRAPTKLAGRDAKLRELRESVGREWVLAAPRHAVYVLCASEVEFVRSEDPEWWLDRADDIPRVCTLAELVRWLDTVDTATMAAHPAAVALPS